MKDFVHTIPLLGGKTTTSMVRNMRIPDGKAYIGIIAFSLMLNIKDTNVERALIALTAGIFYVAYSFAINNCFDIDTDAQNPQKHRKNPIASGELSFKAGVSSSLLIALTGLVFAYFTNPIMFAIYLTMLGLSTFYSIPPRLKSKPIVDIMSHGLFFGALPFLFGAYLDGMLSKPEITMSVALALYSFAMGIRNQLEDYESDLKANLKTTSIVIGKTLAERIATLFSISSITLVLYLISPLDAEGVLLLTSQKVYKVFDSFVAILLMIYLLKSLVS